jgi:hypothetical protein
VYASHTAFAASLAPETTADIETNIGTFKCSESSFSGETTAESGEPLAATIGSMTLGSCKLGTFTCEETFEHRPYSTTFAWSNPNHAVMAIHGLSIFTNCGASGPKCELTASEAPFQMTGGSPATLEISGQKLEPHEPPGGGLCFSAVTFTAHYRITSPSPLYPALN